MLTSEIQTAELELALARTAEKKIGWCDKWAPNLLREIQADDTEIAETIEGLEETVTHLEGQIERAKEWVEALLDELHEEDLIRSKLQVIAEKLENALGDE